MISKITYLFGAGASANALPLIKSTPTAGNLGLPQQLKEFAENFKRSSFNKKNIAETLIGIAERCIEFGTPDLYAKFLLETGDVERYELLKKMLARYFKKMQSLPAPQSSKECFDRRALVFLTTIAHDGKLPSNVGILSWNYDCQIEIAARKLRPVNSQVFKIVKGFTCWPNFQDSFDFDERHDYKGKEIFLLHLNGIAGFNYSAKDFAERTDSIYNFDDTEDTLLSFAWEEENGDNKRNFLNKRIEHAKKISEGTEILVVVGYSFPFFNRKLDDIIMDSMRNTLTKIYYQDPHLDGSRLFDQFNLKRETVKIDTISWVENYYIPYEF